MTALLTLHISWRRIEHPITARDGSLSFRDKDNGTIEPQPAPKGAKLRWLALVEIGKGKIILKDIGSGKKDTTSGLSFSVIISIF